MKHYFLYSTLFIFTLLQACVQEKPKVQHMKQATAEADLTNVKVVNAEDPVCHMKTADYLKDTTQYKGEIYGFCSSHCKEEFKKNPKNYME